MPNKYNKTVSTLTKINKISEKISPGFYSSSTFTIKFKNIRKYKLFSEG